MSATSKAVFLSYASQDADTARQVCEALRAEGVEVWFDQSQLTGGDAWDASIRQQIRDCALFVPIISAHTQERREGYFRLEWKIADERSHLIAEGTPFLLPVVADGIKERDALVPKSFLNVQWTWLAHGGVPPAFVLRVKRLLSAPAASGEQPLSSSGSTQLAESTRRRHRWFNRASLLPWAIAILFAALFFWKAADWDSTHREIRQPSGPPVTHSIISLPIEAPLAPARAYPLSLSYPSLALSPDGSHLVYVAHIGSKRQLYLRPMNEPVARPIPGTIDAYLPFFSPDGRWIGFFIEHKLNKVSVLGGAPIALCELPGWHVGACWGEDRMIYFAPFPRLARVPETGGAIEYLQSDRHELLSRFPAVVAGSNHLVGSFFTTEEISISGDYSPIGLVSLATKTRKTVVERGYNPKFVSSGHLVFARGTGLSAIAFDVISGKSIGEPVPVIDGVRLNSSDYAAQFAVSANGSLVYAAGRVLDKMRPAWVDRNGRHAFLPIPAQIYGELKLSPDGRRVAIRMPGVKDNLTIFNVETGERTPLIEPGINGSPVWTPDGKKLVFHSVRDSKTRVYGKTLDGSLQPAELVYEAREPDGHAFPESFSPDGRVLLVRIGKGHGDIFGLSLDGSRDFAPILRGQDAFFVQISPNGKWLCFTSTKSGTMEIYVHSLPAGNQTHQITFKGGEEPIWSARGDELFYRTGDSWMAIPITLEPTFKVTGPAREIYKGSFANVFGYSEDVAPDAQRFLMLLPEEEDAPVTELHVITNWSEELKRRVPIAGAKSR